MTVDEFSFRVPSSKYKLTKDFLFCRMPETKKDLTNVAEVRSQGPEVGSSKLLETLVLQRKGHERQ